MKVNLLVEYNRKIYNLNYKSRICKIKTMTKLKNFYKYPSKSTLLLSAMFQINTKRKDVTI